MTAPITLWLLNRVVGWEPARLIDALHDRFDVKLGRRVIAGTAVDPGGATVDLAVNADGPGGPLEPGRPGELMHEGYALPPPAHTAYDEYFMPIPVKCVGDPRSAFWQRVSSSDGRRRLGELEDALVGRFGSDRKYSPTKAKAAIGERFGEVRMNLADPSIGYYELLHRAKAASGANNILIGYSQGGLVARYLAFLDEQVADPKERCIHGVLTVQSPNRGSPVASPAKSPDVSRAMLEIGLSFLGWLPTEIPPPLAHFVTAESGRGEAVNFVTRLLDALLASWTHEQRSEELLETWETGRKWLSGLSGVEDLAFWDLDATRLGRVGSVLQAVNEYPLTRIRHGAIIGTDNQLDDLSLALLEGWSRVVGGIARLWKGALHRVLLRAGQIYGWEVMSYLHGTPGTVAHEYLEGIAQSPGNGLTADIGARAHDFVIPSVSEMLLPMTPVHLGNVVNPRASHLTGAGDSIVRSSPSDLDAVVALLRRM